MKTLVKKLYEAMFLIDSALAASDWEGVNKSIRNILERTGAEIVSISKWDERKLAYDIRGQSRGTYILCYFRADGKKIREIERDVQLSEQIMRVLILSAEGRGQADIDKDTPAMQVEKYAAQDVRAAEEAAETGPAEGDRASAAEAEGSDQERDAGLPPADEDKSGAAEGAGDNEDSAEQVDTEDVPE
ncbi:MAG: 30S ribosomal protein S6 [Planctomycetota bacterium]